MPRSPNVVAAHARQRNLLAQTVLIVLCLSTVLPVAADEVPRTDSDVKTLQRINVQGERADKYTVKQTNAGTNLDLSLREIPQSVTVVTQQRIQDQNLQNIGEVLDNVTGVSGAYSDSERYDFYARGFYIDNYQFDGVPTRMEQAWSYGDSSLDMALYDRVEVVRGATGLLTGTGNPSASVNMIRKHADSHELTGSVSVEVGDYNKARTTVDVTTPLNHSGTVRARVIGNYTDADGQMDRYHQRKALGYGVIDADLTDNTLLSVGYSYQKKNADDVTWGGFPLWYSDGSRTHYSKSFNPGTNWTFWETNSKTLFATLSQKFDSGWKIKVNVTHEKSKSNDALFYPFYTVYGFDRNTGQGVVPYSGRYLTHRKVDGLDGYAEGPFQLFGREHQLVAGVSYNRREYVNTGAYDYPWESPISYKDWAGDYAQPDWGALQEQSSGTITQKAAYAAARFSLADPLTLIVGARYTNWKIDGDNAGVPFLSKKNKTTPYAGLVYDFNEVWSAYASYTSIFNPQTYRDANGKYLDPLTGNSYEAGVKAAWFDNQLNASLSVFRTKQDNVAQWLGGYVSGSSDYAYEAADGTVSKGYELEVSGRLADGWEATFGVSRYILRDGDGDSINTHLPRTNLKLFTSYTPPSAQQLTFGGGVNWQNRIYYVDSTYGVAQQGAYALVNIFARYRLAPQFAVQLNINNVLDKDYYSQLTGGYGAWGNGRTGSLTFTYSF